MPLYHNKEIFIDIIRQVSLDTGIPEDIIEKDYYVSLLLKELSANLPDIVFKGGTSLSKGHKIIQRFSEDIDLSYYTSTHDKPGNGKKKKLKQAILTLLTQNDFLLLNPDDIRSRRSFNQYQVDYSAHFNSTGSINPTLLIETYCFNSSFPIEKMKISNYIHDFLVKNNSTSALKDFSELVPFSMNLQSLERTFVDKLFAICDKYLFNQPLRHSRHLYDLHFIWISKKLNIELLEDTFQEIQLVLQEEQDRNPSAKDNFPIKATFEKVLEEDFFKKDYEQITFELANQSPDYDVLKNSLYSMIDRLDFLSL